MANGKIRIDTHGQGPVKHWDFYFDGVNITKFVRGVRITADVRGTAVIELVCVGDLIFPNELEGVIRPIPEEARGTWRR